MDCPQKYKNFLRVIRSCWQILICLEKSWRSVEWIDYHRTYTSYENKKSVSLYDLTIAQQSNDYFEDLSNDFKYQEMEIVSTTKPWMPLLKVISRANDALIKSQKMIALYRSKAKQYLKDEGMYVSFQSK